MKLTHDLSVDFCGKHFINPFSIAASPPSDRRERIERAFEAGWAGAVFKTTSVEEEPVHLAYPIMSACAGRGLNAYGNIDLISERHISEICSDTRYLKERYPDRILIGSIMARNRGEWELLVHELEEAGIDMIECSMSCPQGDGSGVIPVTDPGMTKEVTGWIRDARRKDTPIIVKLTPMVANLTEIALAAKEGGADAVCAIDSVHGYCGIDLDTMLPKLSVGGKSTYCGISGPAVKPVALACVSELARTVGLPVAGVGGISTWEDAAEFLLLGAGTLQLCTAVMRNGFGIIAKLLHGLDGYMQEKASNAFPTWSANASIRLRIMKSWTVRQKGPRCGIRSCASDAGSAVPPARTTGTARSGWKGNSRSLIRINAGGAGSARWRALRRAV